MYKAVVLILVTVLFLGMSLIIYGYYLTKINQSVSRSASQIAESPASDYRPDIQIYNDEPFEVNRFVYLKLTEYEQSIYLQYLDALKNFLPGITVEETPEAELFRIFEAVMLDYPELFWVNLRIGFNTIQSIEENKTYSTVTFSYLFDEETANEWQRKLDNYAQACFITMPDNAQAFDKILHVYQYIISNTQYNSNAPNNQNILSVVEGASVCSGYAKMTQYLLTLLEIPCTRVSGTANREGAGQESHTWNLVNIEEEYYHLDATWGDPQYIETASEDLTGINYTHFLVTDQDIAATHEYDGFIDIPACTGTKWNYYKFTNKLLDTYDPEKLADIIKSDLESGSLISFRFTSAAEYQKTIKSLFDNQDIFDILRSIENGEYYSDNTRIRYSEDDDMSVISIVLFE